MKYFGIALVIGLISPIVFAIAAPPDRSQNRLREILLNSSLETPRELVDSHIVSSLENLVPAEPAISRESLILATFKQKIDHFGQLAGETFKQRYWIDSQYASSPETAPILFHICGEGDAEKGYFLSDNAIEWAKELGAHLVYLEHRYYGKSRPFDDLSADHLKFLTLGNVIEDLSDLQRYISAKKGWKGKWISIGGSYSGTLSAIYRQQHPELVVGALASSAPMLSGVDQLSSVDYFPDLNSGRQWLYQACTTFRFWVAIRSILIGPASKLCRERFGKIALADSEAYNQKYYFPFVSSEDKAPTQILFTYGSRDIWTRLGFSKNQNPNISIRVIEGAGHHYDLNQPKSGDTPEVVEARDQFLSLAKTWLAD